MEEDQTAKDIFSDLFVSILKLFLFFGLLTFLSLDLASRVSCSNSTSDWIAARGLLTKKGIAKEKDDGSTYYWITVEYLYLVDDTLFSGWRYTRGEVSTLDRAELEAELADLSGPEIEVLVDPNDYFHAALSSQPQPWSETALCAFFCLLCCLGFINCVISNAKKGFWNFTLVTLIAIAGGMGGYRVYHLARDLPPHEVVLENDGSVEFERLLTQMRDKA